MYDNTSAGILVRYLVPWLGEKLTMQIGLLGFAVQCILIGLAQTPWMVFASMSGSMLSNLVYPSISSLVSKNVGGTAQGEVLGTINGVRALTGESPFFWVLFRVLYPGTCFVSTVKPTVKPTVKLLSRQWCLHVHDDCSVL
jgi:MFS family permease